MKFTILGYDLKGLFLINFISLATEQDLLNVNGQNRGWASYYWIHLPFFYNVD